MEFVVNERSLHSQFVTSNDFFESLKVLLGIRARIEREKHVMRCHSGLLEAQVTPALSFRQAVRQMRDLNLQRSVMTWLNKAGPFWDEDPAHSSDEYFEVAGSVVTDTGIAEAALAVARRQLASLVSFKPSNWAYTPIPVDWIRSDDDRQRVDVDNHWTLSTLEGCLLAARAPLASWTALVEWAEAECPKLRLSEYVIQSLDGHPFVPAAAERFQLLLTVLNKLKADVDEFGEYSIEGHRLYQDYFCRKQALFTDSSETEVNQFKRELTFRHPEKPDETLFCTWHGKVKVSVMRMHFTFPIRQEEPLYVVYIGPKLTKR